MTTPPPNNNPTDADDNFIYTWREQEPRADLPTSFFQFLPVELENSNRTTPPTQPATPSPPTISTEDEDFIEDDIMETNNNPPVVVDYRNCVHSAPPPVAQPHPSVTPSDPQIKVTERCHFIWTVEEAKEWATVMHLGPSSCGLVAILDVLSSLCHPTPASTISTHLTVNLRAPASAPIDVYLLSRSRAGTTADDLVQAVTMVTNGEVVGRFFRPGRGLSGNRLGEWLTKWVEEGCTPLVTLPQRLPQTNPGLIPDAWHHQMIHGVSTTTTTPNGPETTLIHLTNPLESLPVDQLLQQIQSESVLLIRREDILSRIDGRTDLRLLARLGQRWNDMNVLGSTAHLLHESHSASPKPTPHLAIPAEYIAGITLFTTRKSLTYEKLLSSGTVID